MPYQHLLWSLENGVVEITLNRPEVLNSFNQLMGSELQHALEKAADRSVRSVLLTGSGRGFCAGQDLADTRDPTSGSQRDFADIVRQTYAPLVKAIINLDKPVVCAVNGVAAGAGANLALCCDLVLAAESASFLQAFVKIGLVPDTGGTWLLPRIVGSARAKAMMMVPEKLSAQDAWEIGLTYRTCKDSELLTEARSLARYLATQPTRALGMIKRLCHASASNSLEAQLEMEARLQSEAGKTRDHAEGVAAFQAKRPPEFQGE